MDKHPEVCPVGIGETLCRAVSKLEIRAVGNQAKRACGSLQLSAGLEDGKEEVTQAVAQIRWERTEPAPGERAD